MPSKYRLLLFSLVTPVLLLFNSCNKDEDANPYTTFELQKISGDDQEGIPGEELPEPIIVKLVNGKGEPARDMRVIFTIAEGGGSVHSGVTDQEGKVRAFWTLGHEVNQRLHVTVARPRELFPMGLVTIENTPLFFTANRDKLHIHKVSGDNQKGFPGVVLADTLKIRVVNSNGVPRSNVPVRFITANYNQLINASQVTDQNGYAKANWILDLQDFTQSLEVKIEPERGEQVISSPLYFTAVIDAEIVAGGNGSGNGPNQLSNPSDIFITASGDMYISDRNNGRIQKWAPGASSGITVATRGGQWPNQIELSPISIYVEPAGNMLITEPGPYHRITKWEPGASSGVTVAGGNGGGNGANQFYHPAAVVLDNTGNMYVADQANNRVQKWAPGASSGVTIAGGVYGGAGPNQLHSPHDITIDASGNLYIIDTYNHRVQKWTSGITSGVTVAGGNGQGSGANQLNYPNSLFVDSHGNVYVSDYNNRRTQKWAPGASSGVTVAGAGSGIWVDAAGAIYVVDDANNRVLKWDQP